MQRWCGSVWVLSSEPCVDVQVLKTGLEVVGLCHVSSEFYSLGTKRDRPICVISSNRLEQAGVFWGFVTLRMHTLAWSTFAANNVA